jgi:hypothetical protein
MTGGTTALRCLLAATLVLGGCATVDANGHDRSRWFVGIVRVVLPDTQGKVAAINVKSLGAGWDSGPFLGWKAGNWIITNPADCQLLVVIRSPAQAENAAKVLQSLKGQQPCIVDYTRSLHL